MPTLPRDDDFGLLAGAIPSDGAAWVAGDHRVTDKSDAEYGGMAKWAPRDYGIEATTPDLAASSWMAWRHVAGHTNVRIWGRFLWRHVSGVEQDVRCGLMARLQGIGSTVSASPERWFEASCYLLEAEIDASSATAELVLRRVDAGVVTDLDSVAGVSWPAGQTRELELHVNTMGGGDVRLYAVVGGEDLLTFDDLAVHALTGVGFFGFLTMDGDDAAGHSRTGIREFRAKRFNTDQVFVHDDFDRPNRVDEAPDYHLRSLWGPFEGLEQVAGAIQPVTDGENLGRFAMYQVRPTSADYDVQTDLTFGTTARHWGGLAIRASKASTSADMEGFTGYLARLRIDDDEENLELLKIVDGTLIESARASVAGLATATPITLKVLVDGDVDVRVRVRVNGSLKITLNDDEADRITYAGQAGLYLLSATATPNVSAGDFTLDDPAAADDSVTVVETGDERVPLTAPAFLFADLSGWANGSRRLFPLPAVPVDAASVALYWSGLRVQNVTGAPTALSHSANAAGRTIYTGFTPASGDRLLVEYPRVGNADFVMGEVPAGTINGTNKQFTLSEEPASPDSVRVFAHGLRLRYAGTTTTPAVHEYSLPTSLDLRVGIAPEVGGQFCVDFPKAAAPASPVFGEVPTGDIDGSNQRYTLAAKPNSTLETAQWINGFRLAPGYSSPTAVEFGIDGADVLTGDTPSGSDWLVTDYVPEGAYLETLDLLPDLPWSPVERFGSLGAMFEYPYEQSVATMEQSRAEYPLRASGISRAEHDYVVEFVRRRKGPYEQFLWTPPDEDAPVTVHLAGNSFKHSKHGPDVYAVEMKLERLIAFNP
jgi:phage-related protein